MHAYIDGPPGIRYLNSRPDDLYPTRDADDTPDGKDAAEMEFEDIESSERDSMDAVAGDASYGPDDATCVILLNDRFEVLWSCPESEVFRSLLGSPDARGLMDVLVGSAEERRLATNALESLGWWTHRIANPARLNWAVESGQRLIFITLYKTSLSHGGGSSIVCKARIPQRRAVVSSRPTGDGSTPQSRSTPTSRVENAYLAASAHGERVGLALLEVPQTDEYIDLFGEEAFRVLIDRFAQRIALLSVRPIEVARVSRGRYALLFSGMHSLVQLQRTLSDLGALCERALRGPVDDTDMPVRVGFVVSFDETSLAPLAHRAALALDHAVARRCSHPYVIAVASQKWLVREAEIARLARLVASYERPAAQLDPVVAFDTGFVVGAVIRPMLGMIDGMGSTLDDLEWEEERRAFACLQDARGRYLELIRGALERMPRSAWTGFGSLSANLFLPASVLLDPELPGLISTLRRNGGRALPRREIGLILCADGVVALTPSLLDELVAAVAHLGGHLSLFAQSESPNLLPALDRLQPKQLFLHAELLARSAVTFASIVSKALEIGTTVTVVGCKGQEAERVARALGCAQSVGRLAGGPTAEQSLSLSWQTRVLPKEIS